MPDNITDGTLPDASQLNAPDGTPTVDTTSQPSQPLVNNDDKLSLDEINKFLGKDFKSKETALKSFKDTFSYVGKKKEDIEREILSNNQTSALESQIKQIRQDMFYKDNPDYAPYKGLIQKIGGDPSEVVNLPEFKDIFEPAKGFKESQKLKTVLESNSRISSQRDILTKANEAMNSGNRSEAESLAVKAVLSTLEN